MLIQAHEFGRGLVNDSSGMRVNVGVAGLADNTTNSLLHLPVRACLNDEEEEEEDELLKVVTSSRALKTSSESSGIKTVKQQC